MKLKKRKSLFKSNGYIDRYYPEGAIFWVNPCAWQVCQAKTAPEGAVLSVKSVLGPYRMGANSYQICS
jgi:hypothetical protein